MIKIVRADLTNPQHAEDLISLMSEYASDPMGGGRDLSNYVKCHLAAALNARNDTNVILAYDEDEAVGLITCIEGFSTFACKPLLNIHDAIVKSEYRGQGIIKKLLREGEVIANEMGCCKMTLEVLEGNKAAQSAYTKYGFSSYRLDPDIGQALFWEKQL